MPSSRATRPTSSRDSYTWTGTLDVPADDTYTLWLQRPAGTVVGHPDGPNHGVNPGYRAGPFTGVFDSVSLSVDGSSQSLSPVSTILANTYPDGPTLNGQYLGLNTVGSALPLTAGPHQISISYAPNAKSATAPTVCSRCGPCTTTCTNPSVWRSLASRNSSPRKQNTKNTTAHTIAQVGMFSRVTDRSANWNVVCATGAEPLGVTTSV